MTGALKPSHKNGAGMQALIVTLQLVVVIVPQQVMSMKVSLNPTIKNITVHILEPVLFQTDRDVIRIKMAPARCHISATKRIDLSPLNGKWGPVPKNAFYELTLMKPGQIAIKYRRRSLVLFVFVRQVIPSSCDMSTLVMSFSGLRSLRHSGGNAVDEQTVNEHKDAADDVATTQKRPSHPVITIPTDRINAIESPTNDIFASHTSSIFTRVLYLLGGIVLASGLCCVVFLCYLKITRTTPNANRNRRTRRRDRGATYENELRIFPVSLSNDYARTESPSGGRSARSSQLELDPPPSYDDLQENQPPPEYGDLQNHQVTRPLKDYPQ